MKNSYKALTILILNLFLFSINGKAQNKNMIQIFDFHTTNRCVTCKAIEANTKYTLETYFKNELESGKITFKVINIDKEENQQIAEKFYASGTSLFLNVINNGNEKQVDLTQFAFMYGKKQQEFSEKLKTKLEKQLQKV